MSEELNLDDLIREFERGNLSHVNDTEGSCGSLSQTCCKATLKHLLELKSLRARAERAERDLNQRTYELDRASTERTRAEDERDQAVRERDEARAAGGVKKCGHCGEESVNGYGARLLDRIAELEKQNAHLKDVSLAQDYSAMCERMRQERDQALARVKDTEARLLADNEKLGALISHLRGALEESACRCRHEWSTGYHLGREVKTMGKLLEKCSRCTALQHKDLARMAERERKRDAVIEDAKQARDWLAGGGLIRSKDALTILQASLAALSAEPPLGDAERQGGEDG